MARSGRKTTFKGYDPSKPPAPEKKPDDRVRTSRQPHRRDLKDELRTNERAESPLGRLWLKKKISYDELLAGERLCVIVGAYRATIAGPRSTSGSGTRRGSCPVEETGDPKACNVDPDGCGCLAARRRYNDSFHWLRTTTTGVVRSNGVAKPVKLNGRAVAMIVFRVCIHREEIADEHLVYLKAGLQGLVHLYR